MQPLGASPADALAMARDAAEGKDVRIGGGASVVRDFLSAGLIDHLHVVQVPIVLGRGVRLAIESTSTPSGVTHLTFNRRMATL